jgi:hypothetical protein
VNQDNKGLEMPIFFNLISILWSILSNDFSKSVKTVSVWLSLENECKIKCLKLIRLVTVDLLHLKPYCCGISMFL